MTKRIVVTGSLAYDHLLKYGTPFEQVLLPDQLDRLSVCFVVDQKQSHFGGTGGNIAYNLGLLNEPCTLIASVGRDFDEYEKKLSSQGMDLSHLKRYNDLETASAIIVTDPNGHQIIQFYPGAINGNEKNDTTIPFTQTDLIFIGAEPKATMMEHVRSAQDTKKPYFFDPGQNIPYFTKEELFEAITGAKGMFLNEYEWALLQSKTGLSEEEIQKKTPIILVTLGEKGSILHEQNGASGKKQSTKINPVIPQKTMDPTGCGDAYRGGFLKGMVEGLELEICAQMGSLLATYCVENEGTQNHDPSWETFKKRYEKNFTTAL